MDEIKRYNINADDERDSRYKLLDRIRYSDGEEIIETQNKVIIPKSEQDIYHTIGVQEEGRLDLVSFKYYNSPLYWWAIAYASNIFDPFSVKAGDIVRVPPLTVVVTLKGVSSK